MVKTLTAVQETWEDPGSGSSLEEGMAAHSTLEEGMAAHSTLEEGMAAHSRTLAWRIPWAEEPGGPSPWGHK